MTGFWVDVFSGMKLLNYTERPRLYWFCPSSTAIQTSSGRTFGLASASFIEDEEGCA